MDRHSEVIAYLSSQLNSQAWALNGRAQWAIRSESRRLLSGGPASTDAEVRARVLGYMDDEEPRRVQPTKQAGVAILRLSGFLCPEPNILTYYGWGTALSEFAQAYRRAVADPAVGSIVVLIDSPGGMIQGGEELWTELMANRAAKRTVSAVRYECGSLAYLIACGTGEIVAAPSADLGSIGCYTVHEDLSGMMEKVGIKHTFINSDVGPYKLEGNPYEPLSAEAFDHIKSQVDAFGQFFVKAVAKGRGVSTSKVIKEFGQGRMVLARDAVTRGMADRVGTVEEVVSKLAGGKKSGRAASVFVSAGEVTGFEPFDELPALSPDEPESDMVSVLAAAIDGAESPKVSLVKAQKPADDGAAERERLRAQLDILELG